MKFSAVATILSFASATMASAERAWPAKEEVDCTHLSFQSTFNSNKELITGAFIAECSTKDGPKIYFDYEWSGCIGLNDRSELEFRKASKDDASYNEVVENCDPCSITDDWTMTCDCGTPRRQTTLMIYRKTEADNGMDYDNDSLHCVNV